MRITFVGLSCYVFENTQGDLLAIDPYYDTPEHALGLKLPQDFKADVFLVSHPDEDHSQLHHSYIRQKKRSAEKDTTGNISVFPHLDIRGTLVKEYNGDLCIAWGFTIDGFRILHLGDNAHVLSDEQIAEIGHVDILIIPMPKADFHTEFENIHALKPRIVIPSHLVLPDVTDEHPQRNDVRDSIAQKVLQDWITNPHANEQTVDNFTYMFFAALDLQKTYDMQHIDSHTLKVDSLPDETTVMMMRKQLGK